MLAVLESGVKVSGRVLTGRMTNLPCCVQHTSVRNYPRKPPWVPQIAKSKMFRVIERKPLPKLEAEEQAAVMNYFELYNRSLWSFQKGINEENTLRMEREAKQVSEEVELERMIKLNDTANERVRNIREAALVEEWKQVEQEILAMKKEKEEQELRHLEETEKFLQTEMVRLSGAIKPEELDQVIEMALAVEYDYNYSLSKDGKFFPGRRNVTEFVDGSYPTEPIVAAPMQSSPSSTTFHK